MPAPRVHLVRHGDVQNPEGVLYGRLPGFPLSERGVAMAEAVAAHLTASRAQVTVVIASPLLRATESAEPIARAFAVDVEIDDRLIEASNRLEGKRASVSLSTALDPGVWRYLINPFTPSWGEPFSSVANRMTAAVTDAFERAASGDVVLVSHELPIWMVHRVASGRSLFHDPRRRRCARSSITTFERRADGSFAEIDYVEAAEGV